MSNDQPSHPHQLQSPEEQEQQILDWVSKELSSGTVVRKELINWFAERVYHRDATGLQVTADFADGFLERHPDLASRLVVPGHSERQSKTSKRDRLQERLQQHRTRAMFGDNPPPLRQPAPFPEGDILHHLYNRYVIRHGNTVSTPLLLLHFPDLCLLECSRMCHFRIRTRSLTGTRLLSSQQMCTALAPITFQMKCLHCAS